VLRNRLCTFVQRRIDRWADAPGLAPVVIQATTDKEIFLPALLSGKNQGISMDRHGRQVFGIGRIDAVSQIYRLERDPGLLTLQPECKMGLPSYSPGLRIFGQVFAGKVAADPLQSLREVPCAGFGLRIKKIGWKRV